MFEVWLVSRDCVISSHVGDVDVVVPDAAVTCGLMVWGLKCPTHE